VLLAILFGLSAGLWTSAPEQIPVHWNIAGEVDRYGGKFEGLLAIPLMALGMYALFRFLPLIDPNRDNYEKFAGAYQSVRLSLTVFLSGLQAAILAVAFGWPVSMDLLVMGGVGLLFIVFGNLMGKLQPNWFVGVRTPWTLSSKTSWVKTHRLAGWLFIGLGLLFVLGGLVRSPWMILVVVLASLASAAWMIIYSYLVWRTATDRVPPTESAAQ